MDMKNWGQREIYRSQEPLVGKITQAEDMFMGPEHS